MTQKNLIRMLLVLTLVVMAAAVADDVESIEPAVSSEAPADPAGRPVAEGMRLETTSIRGNQELPRVMVIVPWKDPTVGDLVGKPANSLVDEVLNPVDRDVFRRQTKYFDQLYADPDSGP